MTHLVRDVLCKFLYFFLIVHLFMSLMGLRIGRKLGVWGGSAPLAKTNYNLFYIFQNCIFNDFGRILNSRAILSW